MNILNNLDLLSVGIAIAGMTILGFTILFNDLKNPLNRVFFYLSITSSIWGLVNYIFYQPYFADISLWLLRFVLFFSVLASFFTFSFTYIYSKGTKLPFRYGLIIISLTIIIMVLTLTPLVFYEVTKISLESRILQVSVGPGIFFFGALIALLNFGGIGFLIKKIIRSVKEERRLSQIILLGFFLMISLIIIFNFILPVFFNNPRFTPLGALFMFPFIAFTSYAILKHKLFDVKIIATATLAFALSIVTFFEIVFAQDLNQIIFRSSVFILVLIFSVFLLKSVRKEVAQREQIQRLADNLEKANVRLKELDRLKSEFVSFATHQIRAPLTAIKGYTSLIIEGSYGKISKEVKGAIDKIYQSSQSLVLVVEDYLNISRIEMGNMKYDFVIKDFDKLLRQIVEELMPNIKKTGLDFFLNIDESKEYKSNIDEGKIKQVIINLIDNAMKYTKEGSITVSLSKDEERKKLLVMISDTGIGISKETMPKLFSKFIRAKNSHEVNIHGTGLGLYIAKQMTEAHKSGKLWVESEGEGKGSKFFVELDAV